MNQIGDHVIDDGATLGTRRFIGLVQSAEKGSIPVAQGLRPLTYRTGKEAQYGGGVAIGGIHIYLRQPDHRDVLGELFNFEPVDLVRVDNDKDTLECRYNLKFRPDAAAITV